MQVHKGSGFGSVQPGTPTAMSYLEGQGDLVSGLIRGMSRLTIRVIGVINLLTKFP